MKRKGAFSLLLVFLISLALAPVPGAWTQEADRSELTPAAGDLRVGSILAEGGMPGWPVPDKPIPHHEPGHRSRAGSYTTQVVQEDELGLQAAVEISGLDAMVADGVDPLAGNYALVNLDQIMMSWNESDQQSAQTFSSTLSIIPGSQRAFDNYKSVDIAAGDLNGDGQAEQIVAWVDPADDHIHMSIGEMPGSLGRTTSAPAVIADSTTQPDGWALDFDGDSDYVNAGSGINLANSSFTVGFWAKRDTYGTDDFAVGHGTSGTNLGLHLGFLGVGNHFRCSFYPPNDLDTTEVYTDTNWHHWACTYDVDTNERTIYRDGVQVAQDTAMADYQGVGELHIGWYLADFRSFDGLIDEVGIWNVAHTQEQIQADMVRWEPDEAGLAAYWHFDEGPDAATTEDASGNFHVGTLEGGTSWAAENAPQNAPIAEAHLLVRGYDEALWHCMYDPDTGLCLSWDNLAGGTLLSAPAVASLGAGQFDAFVIGTDNQVHRRHWADGWSGGWQQVGNWPHAGPTWTGATPELPPVAAVARDGGFDLFRVGPDNTLRWYNGTSWQSLGGMLASGPGAVSLAADHMQVFARGVDEALWTLTFNGGAWEKQGDAYDWQRLDRGGMAEGVTIASAPTALSPGSGQIRVYVQGSDHKPYWIGYDGSSWGSWTQGSGDLASALGASWLTDHYELFAQQDDGRLQHSTDGSAWTSLDGLNVCCGVYDTGLVGQERNIHPFKDYSLDVETGHFLGDGRSQIALAYRTSTGPAAVALFEVGGGFQPDHTRSVSVTHPYEFFSITTGDFLDVDGIDEVALAYVNGHSGGVDYGVDVIRVSGASPGVILSQKETDELVCSGTPMRPAGTIEATSGDLDGDGQDEMAMIALFDCWTTEHACDTYLYRARTRIFDVLHRDDPDPYVLKAYYIEEQWQQEPKREVHEWSVGLTIAAGDVNGDGRDEIVRTWPQEFNDHIEMCNNFGYIEHNDEFQRKLEVYQLPVNPDQYTSNWDTDQNGEIDNPEYKFITSLEGQYTKSSYLDRVAVGDLDRDLVGEIAWHFGTNSGRGLRTYGYNSETGEYDQASSVTWPSHAYYPQMVTGGFTGESLRVGPPNYRRQYSVGRITAIINAPPKHTDILNGVEYDINADDPATKAQLTLEAGTTTHVSLTTKRDWGLSTSFATTFGDPAASHTSGSLTATYGQNFSKESGYLTTFEVQQTREASADDALFYMRTDYDVWEYPVLADPAGTVADHITVVYPVSAPRLRVDRGNACDSWYQPRHQLGNVWSYPSGADQLVDRDEGGGGDLATGSDYLVSEDPSSFTVQFTSVADEKQTSGMDLGFSHEFEWQIGGEEIGFKIAGVGYETRLPSFKFSSKAEYNYSQLAEWEVTTSDSTEVYGYLNGVPGSDAAGYDYAVWPYLYWAEDGYMMLDYTTSTQGTFWNQYNKPDPAFILSWTDGHCNTAEDPQTETFTRDILVDPPLVSAGQPVTLTATVRNFSLQSNTQAFDVTFYLGDPDAGGTQIGAPQTIAAYALGPRAVKTVTVHWTAAGSGDQRIYAVIDPTNQLAEIHDETDPYVNNNKGYGLVHMGALDFVDMGEAGEKIYYPIAFRLNPTMQASLFVPVGNLAANTRFELQSVDLPVSGIAGKAFKLLVYRGELNWDTPEQDYSFQPDADHPPAVMILSYSDADIAGMDEANLTLYRLGLTGWEEAACDDYDVQRFLEENLLAVPLCDASIFALSDVPPATILAPEAHFSAVPTSGHAPLTVTFSDESSNGPTGWLWDFGDGGTSTDQHPTYVYKAPGTFTVTLTAANAVGPNSLTVPDYITVENAVYLPLVLRNAP